MANNEKAPKPHTSGIIQFDNNKSTTPDDKPNSKSQIMKWKYVWSQGWIAKWNTEPDTQAAEKMLKPVVKASSLKISFLAKGCFNKVYDVMAENETISTRVLRIALPIEPQLKTQSEIATMRWVRQNTNIPVPGVLAYDSSRANTVGFEWILMTKIPGEPLDEVWHMVPFSAKESLVKQLAGFTASLFKRQFSGIGSIYDDKKPVVGRIVNQEFFQPNHVPRQSVNLGPYKSSREWLKARLVLRIQACQWYIAKASGQANAPDGYNNDPKVDLNTVKGQLAILERLQREVMDKIWPPDMPSPERTVLDHNDLHGHNILVDDSGALTGIIDWESAAAIPLWNACDYPKVLGSDDWEGYPPDPELYPLDADHELGESYYNDLRDYELTKLRRTFMDEMGRLAPEWVAVYNSSAVQRDFDAAMSNLNDLSEQSEVMEWINEFLLKGKGGRRLEEFYQSRSSE